MEETEIEDYFADCFAKLSHSLAKCVELWYNIYYSVQKEGELQK